MLERRQLVAICVLPALVLAACAANPATGRKQLSLVAGSSYKRIVGGKQTA